MTPLQQFRAAASPAAPKSRSKRTWKQLIAGLLGIAVAQTEPYNDNGFWGGHVAPPVQSVTRLHHADLEAAIHKADVGDLRRAAQICRALRRDAILAGVLATRTGGLVRLPKTFSGNPEMIAKLEGVDQRRGVFDRMFPKSELALLAADGILLGVGIAEMRSVEGRDYPVLRRLDPEYLVYRWHEDAWYYQSLEGLLKITPGDGRWVLHIPGGGLSPWSNGLWMSLGRSFISKEHAILNRENYANKLANAARVAVAPNGASEEQKQSWFRKVMAWGVNTVFGMTPGYDVKLVESNGIGYEVFADIIAKSDEEFMIALAGQVITTKGGTGFTNEDIHKSIRADLIQDTAEGLAHTINEQGILPWVNVNYGGDALEEAPLVGWDVDPPKDVAAAANTVTAGASAIKAAGEALAPYGVKVDVPVLCRRFTIPVAGDADGDGDQDELELDDDEAVPVSTRRAA